MSVINRLTVDDKGFMTKTIPIHCHLPTGPDSFAPQHGIRVWKPTGQNEKTAHFIATTYASVLGEAVARMSPSGRPRHPCRTRCCASGDDRPVRVRGRHRPSEQYGQAEVAANLARGDATAGFETGCGAPSSTSGTSSVGKVAPDSLVEEGAQQPPRHLRSGRDPLMVSLAATSAGTGVDQRRHTQVRLSELARVAGHPVGRAVDVVCPRPTASIEAAVRDGALVVAAVDGY